MASPGAGAYKPSPHLNRPASIRRPTEANAMLNDIKKNAQDRMQKSVEALRTE